MGFGTRVGHSIQGQRNVEALLVRLTRGGFDAGSGCYAGDDDLRYSLCFQLRFKIGVGKCTPCTLCHDDVAGLAIELRNEIGKSIGERRVTARMLGPARCASRNVDQHDRETVMTKGVQQSAVSLDYGCDWVNKGNADNTFLKVNDNESSFRIKRGKGHSIVLLEGNMNAS